MKYLHIVAFLLTVVGALNWGLVGAFQLNLVSYLLGQWMGIENLVYILVGLSALYLLLTHRKGCRMCNPKGK